MGGIGRDRRAGGASGRTLELGRCTRVWFGDDPVPATVGAAGTGEAREREGKSILAGWPDVARAPEAAGSVSTGPANVESSRDGAATTTPNAPASTMRTAPVAA